VDRLNREGRIRIGIRKSGAEKECRVEAGCRRIGYRKIGKRRISKINY
jgi:hypothetical protein